MSVPPPAAPTHLLRLHSHSINVLAFSEDNDRLYSGDASGFVAVTSTRSLRAIAKWQAHSDGLLGLEEWGDEVITHGRDNKLHVWKRIAELPGSVRLGDTAASVDLPAPHLSYSMDINALNYCRFSLMPVESEEKSALIAVPGLIDSSVADIWSLPSGSRIHAAIGQEIQKSIFSADQKGRNNAGIIMGLHLFKSHVASSGSQHDELRLLCAYENGSVTLRKYARTDNSTSVGGAGWEILWTSKLHVETVMAMRVSYQNDFAITVSADHLVCRYDISGAVVSPERACIAHRMKHPGNASIAIREDDKVCAIGGWDGSVRLFSTRTIKPLGTLKYHKSSCQAIEFARSPANAESPTTPNDDDESDDELTLEERTKRGRWLVAGGKDGRISIWSLISFSKS
ncbi:WD-40 repeat-containing protein [Macrolepiota fuliginosa MF-IS2]|uniref:ASTRA-associated protein 1 n=1 Tax=Macrolepiota fuliginosa MF-IS2 TaxID=1400762 RepID=A0A9P5XL18_9AGAR|nr:WD-40 repeat-containing protein [Macrolepiota fuliginosa MF-IS2]